MTELLEEGLPGFERPEPWQKDFELRCVHGHLIGKFKRDVDPSREAIRPWMIAFESGQEVVDEREAFRCHTCNGAIQMPPLSQIAQVSDYTGDIRTSAEHGSLEIICKDIADYLIKQYPDWLWAIRPRREGGMLSIYCLQLSGHYGFHIRISDLQHDARLRVAKRGAGEFLERFGQPRGKMDPAKLALVKRDFRGNPIPDLSDKTKLTKNEKIGQLLRTGEMKVFNLDNHRFVRLGKQPVDIEAEKRILLSGGAK